MVTKITVILFVVLFGLTSSHNMRANIHTHPHTTDPIIARYDSFLQGLYRTSNGSIPTTAPFLDPAVIRRGLAPHGYRGKLDRFAATFGTTMRDILSEKQQQKRPPDHQDPPSLHVCVIGGSMTYGSGLERNISDAWPTHAERLLQDSGWPGVEGSGSVKFTNMAARGSPSDHQALTHVKDVMKACNGAHVFIVDLTINDRPSHPALTVAGNPLKYSGTQSKEDAATSAEGRILMNVLFTALPPTTPVWYVESYMSAQIRIPAVTNPAEHGDVVKSKQSVQAKQHSQMHNNSHIHCPTDTSWSFHWPALISFGIPALAIGEVGCELCMNDTNNRVPEDLQRLGLWNHYPHPSLDAHIFFGHMVAIALAEMVGDTLHHNTKDVLLKYPLNSRLAIVNWDSYIQDTADERPINSTATRLIRCAMNPTVEMTMKDPLQFQPLQKGKCWNWESDVPDKPGWICYNNASDNATMSLPNSREEITSELLSSTEILFQVNTTCLMNTIILTVLRSYMEEYGVLKCYINGQPEVNWQIDTQWPSKTSQDDSLIMRLPRGINNGNGVGLGVNDSCSGSDVVEQQSITLACNAYNGKVKISGLLAC